MFSEYTRMLSVDTRNKIIETALGVFLQKGYDRSSLKEIARGAGVTKGGIYHYFESKEHLFREVLSFITTRMKEWSSSRFGSVSSASDMIAALFDSIGSMKRAFAGIVGEGGKDLPYSFLEVLVNAARREEGVRREMEAIYSQMRSKIVALLLRAQEDGEIRSDVDCEMLAFDITALIEGAQLLSVLDETIDLDTVGRRMYRSIWGMISK
jgi:AcrR family transcriptional regulator